MANKAKTKACDSCICLVTRY